MSLTPSSVDDINRPVLEYCNCSAFLATPAIASAIASRGIMWIFFSFYGRYSTLLHLPFLKFLCVGGCWDRTQDFATLALTATRSNHSAKSHPVITCSPDCMKNSELGSVTSLTIWRIFSYDPTHSFYLAEQRICITNATINRNEFSHISQRKSSVKITNGNAFLTIQICLAPCFAHHTEERKRSEGHHVKQI